MNLFEKTIDGQYEYSGKIVKIRRDRVELPNGRISEREICEHVGGVAILPITDNGDVILVRQFRYAYGEELLEIPAGKMDKGPEGHLECGIRELREETGLKASEMTYLGAMYPSPGFLTEVLHLYCAKGLTQGETEPDEDEFVETVRMPMETLCRMIAENKVRDGKTIAAVCKVKLLGL